MISLFMVELQQQLLQWVRQLLPPPATVSCLVVLALVLVV
jgi:hypothetical protein